MNANYRILNAEMKVMYVGGNSWLTIDDAKKLVNYELGEAIYEYDMKTMERLWEVC